MFGLGSIIFVASKNKSLDGPLPNLCPVIPISNQDGRQAKNRKKGG
jgi:hypothetical protein